MWQVFAVKLLIKETSKLRFIPVTAQCRDLVQILVFVLKVYSFLLVAGSSRYFIFIRGKNKEPTVFFCVHY